MSKSLSMPADPALSILWRKVFLDEFWWADLIKYVSREIRGFFGKRGEQETMYFEAHVWRKGLLLNSGGGGRDNFRKLLEGSAQLRAANEIQWCGVMGRIGYLPNSPLTASLNDFLLTPKIYLHGLILILSGNIDSNIDWTEWWFFLIYIRLGNKDPKLRFHES